MKSYTLRENMVGFGRYIFSDRKLPFSFYRNQARKNRTRAERREYSSIDLVAAFIQTMKMSSDEYQVVLARTPIPREELDVIEQIAKERYQAKRTNSYTLGERLSARVSSILRYLNPANYFEYVSSTGVNEFKPRLELTLDGLREEARSRHNRRKSERDPTNWTGINAPEM